MKIYIAGPMTGYTDFNYPAFYKAADALKSLGHEPINPARIDGREGCKTWLDYMRAALRDVADADAVAMLPGWQDSRGAALEYRIAHDLGLDVRPLTAWTAANLAARDAYAESTACPKCGRCGRRESPGHDCGNDKESKR